jgi:hypothetical protein
MQTFVTFDSPMVSHVLFENLRNSVFMYVFMAYIFLHVLFSCICTQKLQKFKIVCIFPGMHQIRTFEFASASDSVSSASVRVS